MKSLAKNSLFNALYQVLNLIFPLISSIYVARILSPEGVGRAAYAQNIASYFVTAAALGIPTVGLRAVSAARDEKRRLDQEFSELFCLNACFTTVAIVAYALTICLVPAFRAEFLLYIVAGIPLALNYLNIDWLFKGQEEYVYIVVRSIVIKVLSIVALFLFVRTQEDCVVYLLITCLATCGNYIFNAVRARRLVTLRLSHLSLRRQLKPVLVLGIAVGLNAIYAQVDTTMLGMMAGETNVGYYAYAHKVLQIAVGFCTAVTSAFLPRLVYYFAHDREQFDALVKKGVQIVSLISFPAAVGMFLLAPEAIELLFGAQFLPAAQTLRCFAPMILLNAFGNLLCYQMMICSGNENKLVPILTVAACLNITLNACMIPRLQENGAALASICTELFIVVVELIYITRRLHLRHEWKAPLQGIVTSAIMGVVIFVLKTIVSGTTVTLFCGVISGVLVYAAINLAMKNPLAWELLSAIRQKLFVRKKDNPKMKETGE